MKFLLSLLILPAFLLAQSDVCEPEVLRVNVMGALKSIGQNNIKKYQRFFIRSEEFHQVVKELEVPEEMKRKIFKEYETAFEKKLREDHQASYALGKENQLEWKKIEYEDFLYRIRKENGVKVLRGDIYFASGQQQFKAKVRGAYLEGKLKLIELSRVRKIQKEVEYHDRPSQVPRISKDGSGGSGAPLPPGQTMEIKLPLEEERVAGESFNFPDVEAKFPGGVKAMQEFIAKAVKYPQEAIDQGIQGRVYLAFVVEKDGSLSDIKVIRSIHPSLDKEALRVIKSMPKWQAATNRGEAVRSPVRLPIAFKLTNKQKSGEK
ncbi:MAG: energy transducer TonB [Bacteroidetes bacterium]|nr:MAG: energy transducer TonB [Bacteroidota bacterium]